jgi:hypothetical protein
MTMEHTEAIDTGAAERYALGEMGEDERDQYEEHFFDCPDCADEVKAATLFLENAKAVVREEGVPAKEDRRERTSAERANPWAGWKALFWPMPLGAAAALAMLLGGPTVYLAFFKVPQLERARAEAESLQAAPWHFLSVSRSEPPLVRVSPSQRMVGLTLSKSDSRTYPFYLCEVRDASGRVVTSNIVPAPPRGGELQILLPTAKLHPGNHVVAVAGLEAASSRPASDFTLYSFTFERQ